MIRPLPHWHPPGVQRMPLALVALLVPREGGDTGAGAQGALSAENEALRARVAALEEEQQRAAFLAKQKALRRDRLEAVTLHVTDHTAGAMRTQAAGRGYVPHWAAAERRLP